MSDAPSRLAADASTLQSAAERLQADTFDRACAPLVPAALKAIEHTLRMLSRTCDAAASSLVPLGAHGESIAERYARAATEWPIARGGRGPSYEQQARVLSSLHDAGAALRAAAAHCDRARETLAGTMEPVPLRSRSRSSQAGGARRPRSRAAEAHVARTAPSSARATSGR